MGAEFLKPLKADRVVEETEPDEWDLRMLAEYESQADKTTVSFEECLKSFGLTHEDLRD
jgi:hypothetical protein